MIENATCTVLEYACGRYIVAMWHHTLMLYYRIDLQLLFIRYIIFSSTYLWQTLLHIKSNKVLTYFVLIYAEYNTRDTQMLPKLSSRNYKEMLGCKPQQQTRDGRGSNYVESHWHFKGKRDENFVWTTGLFTLLQMRILNLYLYVSAQEASTHIDYKTFNQTLIKFSLLYLVNELKLSFEYIAYKNVAWDELQFAFKKVT